MIVVWAGKGFWVPYILLGCFAPLFAAVMMAEAKDDQGRSIFFVNNWWWTVGLTFLAAGAINWFVGRHYNNRPAELLIDPMTGVEQYYRPNHSFYWLKMEYWGVLFALVGCGFLLARFF